jgi:hypothetical protein
MEWIDNLDLPRYLEADGTFPGDPNVVLTAEKPTQATP